MGLKMLEPWKNPRSKNYWFRRRIPKHYIGYFAGRTEIKISLGTADYDEAVLRCQEENLRLERAWRRHLVGRPPDQLSQEQISALAGVAFDGRRPAPRQSRTSGRARAVAAAIAGEEAPQLEFGAAREEIGGKFDSSELQSRARWWSSERFCDPDVLSVREA